MIDLMGLFPHGIMRYAVGGILIGIATSAIYLGTGIKPGVSSFLESTLSYVSGAARFKRYVASRDWRVVFTLGIVLGAALWAVVFQGGAWVTQVQWWRLFFGGILVGVGTRLGKGCTSGHGICGIASGSGTSVVNVALFVGVAIGVAHVLVALGVSP